MKSDWVGDVERKGSVEGKKQRICTKTFRGKIYFLDAVPLPPKRVAELRYLCIDKKLGN